MKDWIQAATQPVGLAGFALFLVFGFFAKKNKKPAWLAIGFFVMACTALIGGLVIAYRQLGSPKSLPNAPSANSNIKQSVPNPATNQQSNKEVNQESHGNGAVNAVVQGQVTVTNGAAETPSKPNQDQGKK